VADRLIVTNHIPGGRAMTRLLLVGAILLLSGCAAPTQPQTAMPPAPRPSPPRILHQLVLASPQGKGVIELRRESQVQSGVETPVYRAYGGIIATDEVAQWRFAYTKTSLEGAGPAPGEWITGLHAMSVVVTNITSGALEVDWERSAFVDATGRRQRMIHRGVQLNQKSAPMEPAPIAAGATLNEFVFPGDGITFSAPGRASLWNSPAVFERLRPGSGFSIVMTVKSGQITTPREFRFSVVAPPAAAPAPAGPR
jgi:hypothetical protein